MKLKLPNILPCLAILVAMSCSGNTGYISINGFAQGGIYNVKCNIPDASCKPETLKTAIDSILSAIDNSVSGYNRTSILSRFNSGEAVAPDDIFSDLYRVSRELWEDTGGVMDVAAGPVFNLWGFGFTRDSLPPRSVLAAAMEASGMDRLRPSFASCMDSSCRLAPADLLKEPGGPLPELNFNAVAQGYSCDRIADYLRSKGISDMLINVGGEIFCSGSNPSGENWKLAIDRPVDGNMASGTDVMCTFKAPDGSSGIVTSGNYRKYYLKDGRKYSHTIDPRTGYPVTHSLLSATIVAADAVTADAYATACMVLGLDQAKDFINSRSGVEACLIYDGGGVLKWWTSDGFHLSE